MSGTAASAPRFGVHPRILVIRRDNIGDLVCTTPLLTLLRRYYPAAHIAALVNSYNAPVLRGNPDIDELFVYVKGKHADGGRHVLSAWIGKWRLMRAVRARHFDLAILATAVPTRGWLRLAKACGTRHVLAAVPVGGAVPREIDLPVWRDERFEGRHTVEQTALLLTPLGIAEAPPLLTLRPDPALSERMAEALRAAGSFHGNLVLGIHISARKPRQRWPEERFSLLMAALHSATGCGFALFWAPGTPDDPRHPGDDDKAVTILRATRGLPMCPLPSRTLDELIAGLSIADLLICSDGGAMHLAAALGKPILCFFGNSDAQTWRPWGVPHRVLQPASQNVSDVTVEQARDAALELLTSTGLLPRR